MDSQIDTQKLARELGQKRGERGLRAVAEEIGGVSASTLSRIEQGKVPDLDTFIRLCRWLNVSPDRFIIGNEQNSEKFAPAVRKETERETQEITVHLRADKTLDPKTLKALEQLVRLAYEAIERGDFNEDKE